MKTYIIQQYMSQWTWMDIFECVGITQAKKALLVFKTKHPNEKYRMIYWGKYV